MPNRVAQLRAWKRASGTVDTRDELLMTLLASEAIVDSRDFDILYSEDVEELKKEYQVLEARLHAMQKKLKLETKIRDAAASLVKVNSRHKAVSKQSTEQLEVANRKVESAQKELWQLSERTNEINKKLLEHRAGVLSFALRSLETKVAGGNEDSGYTMSLRSTQMSPTSSEISYSSSKTKFDGAHLFAGHENALPPLSPRKLPSAAEVSILDERVKEANSKLQAATEAQNEARREAAMLKVELEGLETSLALELQSAEEKVATMRSEVQKVGMLESQLRGLTAERESWTKEREEKQYEIDRLEQRLEMMQDKSNEAMGTEQRIVELESALDALQSMMHSHSLNLPNDTPPARRVSYLGTYLEDVQSRLNANLRQREEWEDLRHKLEEDLRVGLDSRESLSRELEEARREREGYQEKNRSLEAQLREQALVPPGPMKIVSYENAPADIQNFVQMLKPVWNALPSPELRASKFGHRTKPSSSVPGSPNMSLSELDVRLLRTLYDGRPSYQTVDTSSQFTVEAFAARVQALIADDRALIERLVRFAQAHELLKQNADRAQKIAQESSVALETYQKQVKALEERNMTLQSSVNSLQNEIVELQGAIEKVTDEKREVETHAAEQAETCRQLTEANNTLSARALSLAQEAASAPEAVRTQLEKQLAECRLELQKAQDDIDAMRSAEASQNLALMDELNHMQGQNENLRAQLRAVQAGKK
ncbi:uncharacterized protein FOMMEDRAFT_126587 [Fomitiporia mediterranea MF3/22]|uniref:uncharacterized protein n=1 Tax=Fomitiporia mediterranea (strain MF3/22) TaxID=694068 RepID=UPI0004407E80|nr:uncharacterized protein FOMMEDRAFT_126587 [Fomitiporia mediterranea MF3/22]EJD01560.1 hypothetical protein FOMMEDRAFT_126587 [Fomitiporia mediterranea MF3/22]